MRRRRRPPPPSPFDYTDGLAADQMEDLLPESLWAFLPEFVSELYNANSDDALEPYLLLNNMLVLSTRLAQLLNCPKPIIRRCAAFALSSLEVWDRLSDGLTKNIQARFIRALQNESDLIVLQDLCSAVSPYAFIRSFIRYRHTADWPDVVLFIRDSFEMECSVRHFAILCLIADYLRFKKDGERVPDYGEIAAYLLFKKKNGEQVQDYGEYFDTVCLKTSYKYLNTSQANPMIRVAAIRALMALFSYKNWDRNPNKCLFFYGDLDRNRTKYQHELDTVRKIMTSVIYDFINNGETKHVKHVINIMFESKDIGMWSRNFAILVDGMISLADMSFIGDDIQQLAVKFLLDVANSSIAFKLLEGNFLSRLINLLIKYLASINEDDNDGEDMGDKFSFAKKSLRILSTAMRKRYIVPDYPEREELLDFLNHSKWVMRHALVTALALISEGTSKEKLVEKVLLFLDDPHPRVRWAVINAVGQFSKDSSPQLQQQFHHKLVPALVAAMDDSKDPRVQEAAFSAMQLFCHSCPPDILKPYLEGIVSKLLYFLQNGKKKLKEGALTALASIASSMQKDFQQHYETVISYLKPILTNETDKTNCMLVTKSIDCITMVGMAVGKEKFKADAEQVVKVLVSLQQSQLEEDDPMRRSLLKAWGGLCKCLGKDFIPYMSVAMPKLLESAQLKNYLDVNTNLDGTENSYNKRRLMKRKIGCHTAVWQEVTPITYVLEEKALACNMLCCCAAELKEGLHLWIKEVAQTLVPLLSFQLNNEIRSDAAIAMPLLLRSTISAVEEGLQLPDFIESPIKELTHSIIPALEEALKKECNEHIRPKIFDSLNECMQVLSDFAAKKE